MSNVYTGSHLFCLEITSREFNIPEWQLLFGTVLYLTKC